MNTKQELLKIMTSVSNLFFATNVGIEEIKISAKEVGGKVEKINPATKKLEAIADGDYNVEGFEFTVVGGVITSIVGQEAPVEAADATTGTTSGDTVDMVATSGDTATEDSTEEPAVEEPAVENVRQEQIDELTELIGGLSERLTALEEMISATEMKANTNLSMIEKFGEAINTTNEMLAKIVKTPVQFSQTNKSFNVENDKQNKMIAFGEVMKNVLNK